MAARIIELNQDNTCKICENAFAKYACPQCGVIYCSLGCYQDEKHLKCSENFYKECCLEQLSLEKDKDAKTKIMEALKRSHEFNHVLDLESNIVSDSEEAITVSDSDDEEDLVRRLSGVNLDNAEQVWEKLTEQEKNDFAAFLRSEDVTKFIASWKPWWLYSDFGKVKELKDKDSFKANCPELRPIKDFSTLTQKKPSDCVRHNLTNVIASYAFTARYFNGEHHDFAQEAVSCLSAISKNLSQNENFSSYEIAVKSVEQASLNTDWIITDSENITLMFDDTERILKGPNREEPKYYILSALSDMSLLIEKGMKPIEGKGDEFSKKFPNNYFPTVKLEKRENMKKFLLKIDYLLSFAKCF